MLVSNELRVGVGGLVRGMYVSRLDRFVWIERGSERPWLITPDRPEMFVQVLSVS